MIPRFVVAKVYCPFNSFAEKCNFGLSLDADHRITPAFQRMYVEI